MRHTNEPDTPLQGAPDISVLSKELIETEKQEQEIAEGCKRLIKNCIICWNYLYLIQKLSDSDDPDYRAALLGALTNGSVISWRHINLLGQLAGTDLVPE